MNDLVVVLGVLGLALFVLVTLLEKFVKPKQDDEKVSDGAGLERFIMPLVALLALLQLLNHYFLN